MKGVFIIPPSPDKKKIIRAIDCSHETKANYLWQPNDFMIISSLLKPDDKMFFIDGTADSLLEKVFFDQVQNIGSADILFYALSSVCWNSDYSYLVRVKKYFPETPVFVIGDIFVEEKYRELILKECDGIISQPYDLDIDKMMKIRTEKPAEIEGVCTDAAQTLYKEPKKAKWTSGSGIPRHEMFLKKGYKFPFARHFKFATVTSLWSCPFTCSYCTNSKVSPIIRPYEDIIKELEYIDKLGVKELFFGDKAFGFPCENSIALLKEMSERFSFSWSCYHHPGLYKPELLELMAKSGCHTIIIGIDSVDFESLSRYNRNVNKERVEELINHANKLNMSICADFIIGLDHETEQDIIKTIEYGLNLPLDFASFNIATPVPGSHIRENAIKQGKIELNSDGFDSLGNKAILDSEKVSSQRLTRLKSMAVRKFYTRPSYIWRRLTKTTTFEHFAIQFLEMLAMIRKL